MATNIVSQEKLLGAIDRILIKKSIAARCSDKQPMTGPLGIVLGMQRDHANDKLIISREEVIPDTETIKTEFTQEAIDDLFLIYGEEIYDVLAHYLIDDLAYRIDARFIDMLKARATSKKALAFSGAEFDNSLYAIGQSIAINVNKCLSNLPISDNRAAPGFAIVSSDISAILAVTVDFDKEDLAEADKNPSYMGKIANVSYYTDYTHANDGVDSVVFGISGNGISKGSAIYCPYKQEWMEATDPETGEKIFFLFDRTGMTINPIDKEYYNGGAGTSGFVGKFDVDLSTLQIFN